MAIRSIRREASTPGAYPGTARSAPIFVDSDDNILKIVPAGSGTTNVQVVDASSTQTLTNKTLTSPTITSPTITTPTITGSLGTRTVETVTTTNELTAAESGTLYFLSAAGGFVTTLPAPAAGVYYDFIVATAPSGGSYTIITAQSGAACEILAGHAIGSDPGTDSTPYDFEATATADTITLVDGKAVIGDRVHVVSDGTSWFAEGVATVFDAITFTG